MPLYPSAGSLGAPVNVAAAHHGRTDHVFTLSDMKFSKSRRETRKPPSLTSTLSEGVARKIFYFSKSFFNLPRILTFGPMSILWTQKVEFFLSS